MFTGIIENIGEVIALEKDKTNLNITLKSKLTNELKIDQSIAHNGICLTVVDIDKDNYTVTAIDETLSKTNLRWVKVNDKINLERAMKLGDRLDGHMVQGHVDQIGKCIEIAPQNGSWIFTFEYDKNVGNITIEKGSITVNGISLTVLNAREDKFSVAIIPYTYEHTNFYKIKVNDFVNLEFDVIGKYIKRLSSNYNN